MLYINGIPLSFNKTIRPKKFLIYFILIFLLLILLSFISLPEFPTSIRKSFPNITHKTQQYSDSNIKHSNSSILTNIYYDFINIETHIKNKYIYSKPISHIDIVTEQRRLKVKEMMKFAWDNYVQYAFGYNELKPISKQPHLGSVFGRDKLGLTIVDSLDTLLLMNLTGEYQKGYDWIMNHLSFTNLHSAISIFETNIRYIGGLITLYLLTQDYKFIEKALGIADVMMPAFDTPEGLPYSTLNTNTNHGRNYLWANGDSFILSEIGTLHLEFMLLSKLSGVPIYAEKVLKIREYLANVYNEDGLVNNYINPLNDKSRSTLTHVSLGGLGDSYYEYLLKSYVISNHEDVQAKTMFDNAMRGIRKRLVKSSPSHLVYLAQIRDTKIEHKMDHLACFFGGLMALSSQHEQDEKLKTDHILLAQHITETCHKGYTNSPLGLAPEVMQFDDGEDASTRNPRDVHYILRPETFESYFYMWRLTKDPKYREWAWDAVLALENYTRVDAGFSGLKNVYPSAGSVLRAAPSDHDDVQQSYFMSESLKYLYLIFCPDEFLPLDSWIFNTEGHPFLRYDLIDTAFPPLSPLGAQHPDPPPPPPPHRNVLEGVEQGLPKGGEGDKDMQGDEDEEKEEIEDTGGVDEEKKIDQVEEQVDVPRAREEDAAAPAAHHQHIMPENNNNINNQMNE